MRHLEPITYCVFAKSEKKKKRNEEGKTVSVRFLKVTFHTALKQFGPLIRTNHFFCLLGFFFFLRDDWKKTSRQKYMLYLTDREHIKS